MNYPAWNVPVIGSGWVIGIIAIIHVLISHFAVGGGLFLALAEGKALKEGRRDWLLRLRGYSKFFLVFTGVFGAMTGVGIWFAIGLANPTGTSALIHNFVFGWATEWVVFLVELTLAAAYYYTWGRIPEKTHLRIGQLYAVTSFLTLVIINGILTFKLTPGLEWLSVAGTGRESDYFFEAFFNAGYWPSLVLRSLVCVSLAGVYGLIFFSRLDGEKEGDLKESLVKWSAKWLVPSFMLVPFVFLWYLTTVPAGQRELLGLGVASIGAGAFTHVTRMAVVLGLTSATLVAVVYILAWRMPRELDLGHALLVLVLAAFATASAESVREFLRKPYVVRGYLYSNSVLVSKAEGFNRDGYLASSPWKPKTADSLERRMEMGQRMFQGQCLSCHTLDGYRSLRRLLKDRDEKGIGNILAMLHEHKPDSPYRRYMPPLVGTPEEIDALRAWLVQAVGATPTPPAPPVPAAKADTLSDTAAVAPPDTAAPAAVTDSVHTVDSIAAAPAAPAAK